MVKLMTDGILLAEIQQDRLLMQYDTIIIDEAHERSLNIDFLLGYLKELLPRRPDLKIIITSATIDPERFSKHFNNAPIVEVSGRTYPVEVRYRPIVEEADDTERDQLQAIFDAVDELGNESAGDILIFMSGEREIRDTADALSKRDLRHTEILPLYARLSNSEQNRVFQPHGGRRIVLATNVAETSLTVPGLNTLSTARPASAATATARRSSGCRLSRSPRHPLTSVRAAAAACRKGSVFVSIPKTISCRARNSPTRNSAHQPGVRYPADDRPGAGRHRGVSVRRSAGQTQHSGRRASAGRARGDYHRRAGDGL